MLHKERGQGKKYKARGRPFPTGNNRGKLKDDVLDVAGLESSIKGGIVTGPFESSLVELPKLVTETIDNLIAGNLKEEVKKTEFKELELIETIDFKNGDNTLSIRFSRRHNRMFRIQIFLNNENEIRPVTYTGASTGYAFWNLLKGALKK